MLDNLRFRTSDKLNEYEKEAHNLLAMNVVRFTPIIKNLHRINFQSSWRIVTQIGNLLPTYTNIFGCETETDKTKEKPSCLKIGVFDCGGSRSSARVLRVLHSSLDYVPVRC